MSVQNTTDDRYFTHGASASTADSAVDAGVSPEDRSINGPLLARPTP